MQKPKITHTTWNLKPLFGSDDDSAMLRNREEVERANKAFAEKWKDNNDYLEDAAILRIALDEYEELKRSYGLGGNWSFYFQLRTAQDENNAQLKATENKINDFSVHLQNEIQFFELRLTKISSAQQIVFLRSPDLGKYRHYLKRLFAVARHTLSEAEERVLNMKSAPAYGNWVRMTSGFLAQEEREILQEDGARAQKSMADIMGLIDSTDKAVRDTAAVALNDILEKNAEIAEHEINSILQNKYNDDLLRSFDRPDQDRHISDDIDTDVVDILLNAVEKRFDLAQRYYVLKARMLGVEKLQYHERNVPIGALNHTYTFEDAVDLAHTTFTKLDPQFADIFQRFIENGQYDVYPKKGKSDGAFCTAYLLTNPTYILLNFTGKLRDVLTLAHETGHGINNELMRARQHALYFENSLAIAEVASTFMEDFVVEELLHQADDEMRLSLMMSRLNDDVSTIFRQVACYRFEQELHTAFHERGYLSSSAIGEIFLKHMGAYMGNAVEQSAGSNNWWVYWSHIRNYFYVYSYASGLLISKSMQGAVRRDHAFIENVKEFLSAGTSDSPKNIFASMGIDIANSQFWDRGLDEFEKLLTEAEALAKTLKKIS